MATHGVRVNGQLVRERMLALTLSERDLARVTGLSQTVIRSVIHRDQLPAAVSIVQVHRVLTCLGILDEELFEHPLPAPSEVDEANADVRVLAEILAEDRRQHRIDHLCATLGWTADRVAQARRSLDATLRPIGMRVHQSNDGIHVRAVDKSADAYIKTMKQMRAAATGIDNGHARVLYRVYTSVIDQRQIKDEESPKLGYLLNQRIVEVRTRNGELIRLTPECAYAFQVT